MAFDGTNMRYATSPVSMALDIEPVMISLAELLMPEDD